MSDKRKQRIRALQQRTGWSYQEALRVYEQGLSPDALEALIYFRGGTPAAEPPKEKIDAR